MSALNVQVGGSHYRQGAIQPVEFIHSNGLPFMEGNVVKYVSRWRSKGGIEDLRKARHYLDMLIELEEAKAQDARTRVLAVAEASTFVEDCIQQLVRDARPEAKFEADYNE